MKLTGGSTQNRLRIFAVWAVVVVVAAGAWLAARPASAAVVFKAASTNQNSTGARTLNMSYPPGVASGDLLIAIVTARGGTGTTVSVAKPWNAIPGGAADSGTLITSRMFYTVYSSGSTVGFNIFNNAAGN